MKEIKIRLTKDLICHIDNYVGAGFYLNRAEFILDAVKSFINKIKLKQAVKEDIDWALN